MKLYISLLLSLILVSVSKDTLATVYLSPGDFLEEVFAGDVPKPKRIWIKKELKEKIKNILGHDLAILRVKYWRDKQQTVWILDEIGKEKPITTGLVIQAGKVQRLRVLEFRETRGYEIRHSFFTEQFIGIGIDADNNLDHPIDGITGATLSVRAMKRLARLAVLLNAQVTQRD